MNPSDDVYKLHGVPSPDDLHGMLDEMPDVPDIRLEDYSGVITRLHQEKGLSFKEITEFLKKQGLSFNRSAVYRCYKDSNRADEEGTEPLIDDETGEVVEP